MSVYMKKEQIIQLHDETQTSLNCNYFLLYKLLPSNSSVWNINRYYSDANPKAYEDIPDSITKTMEADMKSAGFVW